MSREHWDSVYAAKSDDQLSWMQDDPRVSLELICAVCPTGGRVIDVGGGTSLLASRLDAKGYRVTVLDISAAALDRAKRAMGPAAAARVQWLVADVTVEPDVGQFDVWHDRAVFHFLTDPSDRLRYAALLTRSVPAGGHAVIATFAPDGPHQCSGLPVQRYDSRSLGEQLGSGFEFHKSVSETHVTPWGKPQSFQYSVFLRLA